MQTAWLLAILLLLISLAKVVWTAYSQSKIRQANYQVQDITPADQSNRQLYQVNEIISANLFGDPTPRVVVKQAPKTTLDLTLQGILWASDAGMARAIIMTGKKKSELYSVGEEIKGAGASVKEIHHHEVLLNRNGATERLPLIKSTANGNRELISLNEQGGNRAGSPLASSDANAALQNVNQVKSRALAPNGAPRKIRKPNFSGLDRAIKKMGEL